MLYTVVLKLDRNSDISRAYDSSKLAATLPNSDHRSPAYSHVVHNPSCTALSRAINSASRISANSSCPALTERYKYPTPILSPCAKHHRAPETVGIPTLPSQTTPRCTVLRASELNCAFPNFRNFCEIGRSSKRAGAMLPVPGWSSRNRDGRRAIYRRRE